MNLPDLEPLDPEARRLVILGYLAEIPTEPELHLPRETVAAIRRAQVVLCTFELPPEERQRELRLWRDHLDGLDEALADAAIDRLRRFAELLDPFRPRPEEDEEET